MGKGVERLARSRSPLSETQSRFRDAIPMFRTTSAGLTAFVSVYTPRGAMANFWLPEKFITVLLN